ncbi:hypothetical protein CRE_16048 [Caenorhabditis remanei]|uniref:Uncharacterized protein n=1 Tax=Caenorhabditis remanei TaxID=31234 RepID=E3MBJ1_CAERE|nr:hypothetical protein CRE_16048 [Caenorhabditis remanei]
MNVNIRVANVDEQRYYFIAPGGKIKFTTNDERVQFGFSLYWQQYTATQSVQLNVSLSDTQPTVLERNGMKPALVKAGTKVSATILSPVYNYLIQNLRTLIFFDGDSWNSTSLGTGLQLLQGNTQFVSTGNSMTVLPLESFYYDYGQIVLQDYELTKDIASFQGLKCTLYSRCEDLKLDASGGPAAFQLYTHDVLSVANVLTEIRGTGNLDVYIGGVTVNKTNLISSYSAEPKNLPQELLGAFKTLVLRNGTTDLTMSAFSKSFKETVKLPRTGFIASTEYGSLSTSQDSHSVVKSLMIAKFGISIRDVDLSGYATLDINGYKNKTLVFARSYYHFHVPIEQEGFYGDTLDIFKWKTVL